MTRAFALIAAAASLLGCSSRAESTDADAGRRDASLLDAEADGTAAAEVAQACSAYFAVASHCDAPAPPTLGATFGWTPYLFLGRPGHELERLRARFAAHCKVWLELPGSGFTPETLADCSSAVEADGCGALHGPSCAFAGKLEVGDPCLIHEQCATGDCYGAAECGGTGTCGTCRALAAPHEDCDGPCERLPACEPGAFCYDEDICYEIPDPAAEGESCARVGSSCQAGLYCDRDDHLCKPFARRAERCSYSIPCEEPFVCPYSSDMSGAAVCDDPPPASEGCTGNDQCIDGSFCSPEGTCQPRVFAEPGHSCSDSCRIGECSAQGPDLPARCPRVIADGEHCDADGPGICDYLAACVKGRCSLAAYPSCEAAAVVHDGGSN